MKPAKTGLIGSLVGRVGVGVAVAGVILGTWLGTPDARIERGSPEVNVTMTAPAPTQVGTRVRAVTDSLGAVLPAGVTRADVLRQLGWVSFSVRAENGAVGEKSLEIAPGTEISAHLDHYGLTISATPGLTWLIDWAPDATLERIRYDFATGRFSATASGLGPDSWYSGEVEALANEHLLARLPPEMRVPGYDPFTDPKLEQTIQSLVDRVATSMSPSARAGGDVNLSAITQPEVAFGVTLDSARTIELPGTTQRAWLEAGTRVTVSLATNGPIDDATLRRLHISFDKPVVIGEPDRDGGPRPFARMELSGIDVAKNGQIALDYELGPEQAVDGLRALVTILAVAAEPRLAYSNELGSVERTRFEAFRREIQDKIDHQLEPELARFVRDHDGALSGVSLLHFFGIDTTRAMITPPR